ncbi:MAG: FtsW/RodA/SpoVE family cell cycle protein [Faecalibacterium prausnitzii]
MRRGLCGYAGADDGRGRLGRARAGGAARRACRGTGGTGGCGRSPRQGWGWAACGSLLAAGAIGCIPLSLDMTSLTVPLALPFWAAGRSCWQLQLLGAKRTGKPLRCWVKKHKMSPETVFLCSFAPERCRLCTGAGAAALVLTGHREGRGAQMATNRKKHRAPVPVFQRDPGPWSRLLIDWLATLAVIMIFGLVMLFSASYTTGYLRMGDSFHYIKQQALCMILGLGCMFLISYVDHRFLRKMVVPGYFIVLAMLAVTLTMAAPERLPPLDQLWQA